VAEPKYLLQKYEFQTKKWFLSNKREELNGLKQNNQRKQVARLSLTTNFHTYNAIYARFTHTDKVIYLHNLTDHKELSIPFNTNQNT
jgi:hypothetical protein